MISVLAAITVKEGARGAFLEIFRANVPKVRQESGCIEYYPAVDIDADLAAQRLDANVITVIEKWQSLEALRNHLASAHMLAYKERVEDLVADVSLKVLQQA